MILILDDSPIRLRMFKQGLIGAPVVVCSRADDTIRLLMQHLPKVVFLDHDLDQFGDHTPGNGMDVINWILTNPAPWAHTLFIVHSVNPFKRPMMYAHLRDRFPRTLYQPHAWENKTLLDQVVHLNNRVQ